jgi:hypothetical protein
VFSSIYALKRHLKEIRAKMRFFHPLALSLCFALQSSANRLRIGQQESAHNTAFHDALLKQLANSRNSTNIVDDNDLFLSSSSRTGPISLLATTGLQVYLNSTVPAPAPPQACVNALIASVNCNSTISFMPFVFQIVSANILLTLYFPVSIHSF